jgi:hypothetical protein
MSAIVCSAAEMIVESGALQTTMPRRVAASMSTLSIPTPARPTTFNRSARSMRSASIRVADRITTASKPAMIDARSDSPSSTTSNRRRRSSTPGSAMGSRTRTRCRAASATGRPAVRLESAGDRDSALDLGTALGEKLLDRGESGRDVEDVVVADVADAEDPGSELAVAARDGDPEAVAQREHEVARVQPVRYAYRRANAASRPSSSRMPSAVSS